MKKTAAKEINLVVISGSRVFGGVANEQREIIRSFKITDLSPSSTDFMEGVKTLASIFASEFFDMDFDEAGKLFEKAKTLEELEKILKKDLYEENYEGWKQFNSISIIEIKNEFLLDGLIHLPESSFNGDYDVEGKVKELKKDEKFKEALELRDSFIKLEELVKSNPKLVSQTELERITKLFEKVPPEIIPDSWKKEREEILEKYYKN